MLVSRGGLADWSTERGAGSSARAYASLHGGVGRDSDPACARWGERQEKLFDGKTLDGWQGNLAWWSVEDGAIVGNLNDKVPTSFLFTKDNYSDFRLTLS